MQPLFVRTNLAIRYTLEYYGIDKIKDYMFRFAGGLNLGYLDTWEETIYNLHRGMENEIEQTKFTSKQKTIVYLFEWLKEWLGSDRICSVNKQILWYEINKYNDKTYEEFALLVEQKVKEHRSNPNFKRNHLEEYETDFDVFPPNIFIAHSILMHKNTKIKKVNYRYYCIQEKPELIDTAYIEQYFQLVDRIISNFRRIVSKQVALYDAGKIVPFQTIIIEKNKLLEAPETPALLEQPKESPKKIKVNLSVPQLAYLFKLLYDFKLIDISSKTELKKFIILNFSTKASEEISDKSLENKLSTTEKAEADFWANMFMEMFRAAKKV